MAAHERRIPAGFRARNSLWASSWGLEIATTHCQEIFPDLGIPSQKPAPVCLPGAVHPGYERTRVICRRARRTDNGVGHRERETPAYGAKTAARGDADKEHADRASSSTSATPRHNS